MKQTPVRPVTVEKRQLKQRHSMGPLGVTSV